MFRALGLVFLALALAACSGEPDATHDPVDEVEVVGDPVALQIEIMEEMIAVLAEVTNEDTARAAAPRIEELSARLAAERARVDTLSTSDLRRQREIAEENVDRSLVMRHEIKTRLAEYAVLADAFNRGGSASN